ncbi:MAG TPA: DMT family transporter [Acidimicrobiales bacterium]|nr:DMT family transporter [Acidimicrobiales bacterium]
MLVAAVAALASAALSALALAALHRSAGMVRDLPAPAGLGRFLVGNTKHPLWLLGMTTAAVALVLHAVALHDGPLTLVQPLMVSGIVFALALRQLIEGRRPARNQLGWAATLAIGLMLFLLAATPGQGPPQPPDTGPTLVFVIAIPTGMAVCALLGRGAQGKRAAALLGAGAGLAFAGAAALLKEVTDQVTHGLGAVFGAWPVYALLVAGFFGLVFNQLAFGAAPLPASLPALSTVDPLASLAIGVWVFDEPYRSAAGAVVTELIGLSLVMVAVVALSRHATTEPRI